MALECNHQVFWETPEPRSPEKPVSDEEWAHTDRHVAYTLIGDVLRNPDGSGSYSLTLHYRDGTCEVHTVVVSTDGAAKVYNQGGFVVGSYPAGTTVVPPQDFSHRMGVVRDEPITGSDTAEAWPY
jgi:hypothetical protein